MDYMLIRKPYGDDDGATGGVIWDAANASITDTVNGEASLSFTIPQTNICNVSLLSRICLGDEEFIVEKMSLSGGEYDVSATQRFVFESKRAHIPEVGSTDDGDFIGVHPYTVLRAALANAASEACVLLSDSEITALGYSKLGGTDETVSGADLLIDFEAVDKTTLWDVLQQIIEKAGRGEIYRMGAKFALVDSIGKDRGALIPDICALTNVTLERDCSEMITKLYPYGNDSLDITSASANTSKTAYILSDNADVTSKEHAPVAGYKNYDLSKPDELFERALWEFDEDNPDRIDVPAINLSGSAAEMELTADVDIGDTVHIMYNGDILHERVIKRIWYPLSGKPARLSIGRAKKDAFFYLNQVGVLAKRYKNVSAVNGKIFGQKLSGSIKLNGTTYRINS